LRRRRSAAVLAALVLASGPGPAQDALARATRAFERGNELLAQAAVLEIFASAGPNRGEAIQASVEALRNAGGSDVWVAAASDRVKTHPDDAILQFYLGATWQDLKHLRRAEEALGQARRLAPDNPAVQESWAWNARLRFDAAAAVDRSRGASFAGADRFAADQQARLAGQGKGGTVAALGLLGTVLVLATVVGLVRFGSRQRVDG
jgi:tetratricopeptide (TPR) repeat protein